MRSLPISVPLFCFFLLALSGCSQSPSVWWASLNAKAKHLEQLEASYGALEQEHDRLKKDYYRLENDYMDIRARLTSEEKGNYNLRATGKLDGRAPSSIAYSVPKGLRAEDALALAYEHFTEKRFAEAAVTFEDFLKRPESAASNDSLAVYTVGVAWFQLGNYHKARHYFEEAKSSASGDYKEKILKKSDLWLRAIDKHERERVQGEHRDGPLGG